MVIEVEFGSRGAAGTIRNDPQYKPFLHDSDDGRQSTLKLKESTPESALNYITGEAAESNRQEAEKAGQSELTRKERERIDFSREGVNVPFVRSVKGIAENVGVTDFMQFADFTLSVDENRSLLERAAKQERGSRDLERDKDSDAMIDKRLSEAHVERKRGELDRAKHFALVETDPEAQEFVQGQGEFDIGFNRQNNRLVGQGEDFERLDQRHENRSERAQTADEMRDAKVTRDPIQWSNNPAKYDFPGIDTVQPRELHNQRSERAQEKDENELAPPADTKQEWAMNPDQYDWPGIDTPSGMGLGAGEQIPSESEIPTTSNQRTQRGSVPSTERNTEAPITETSQLAATDVSLSPGEAFEGVGSGFLFGERDEIDKEQEPPQEALKNQMGAIANNFTDDRDKDSQLLDFGMDTDATQHRESKTAAEQATSFGVDDRDDATRGAEKESDESEQQGFEVFGAGVRENETLF